MNDMPTWAEWQYLDVSQREYEQHRVLKRVSDKIAQIEATAESVKWLTWGLRTVFAGYVSIVVGFIVYTVR